MKQKTNESAIIYEAKGLATSFPDAWSRVLGDVESLRAFSFEHGITDNLEAFASGLEGQVTAGIFDALAGVFGGAISFVLVLVLTFYLAAHATTVRRTLIGLASARWPGRRCR